MYSFRLFLLLLSIYYQPIHAKNLTAVLSSVRLPTPRVGVSAVYDGDDTIYLFGGTENGMSSISEVYGYSISTDSMERAGRLPRGSYGGAALRTNDGDIFYMAGCCASGHVFQYFPAHQNFTTLSQELHPYDSYFGSVIQNTDTALLFSRESYCTVYGVNLNTGGVEDLYLFENETLRYIAAVWDGETSTAYLFTGAGIYTYTRSANRFESFRTDSPINSLPQAVTDGAFWYIVGGVDRTFGSLLKFDTRTGNVEPIHVEGFPGNGVESFGGTGAVYVEKLNSIYMFGGLSSVEGEESSYADEIWYISLDPLNSPVSGNVL